MIGKGGMLHHYVSHIVIMSNSILKIVVERMMNEIIMISEYIKYRKN